MKYIVREKYFGFDLGEANTVAECVQIGYRGGWKPEEITIAKNPEYYEPEEG